MFLCFLACIKVKIDSIWFCVFGFYRTSAVAASPVLATIGMSVRPSVCLSHAGIE